MAHYLSPAPQALPQAAGFSSGAAAPQAAGFSSGAAAPQAAGFSSGAAAPQAAGFSSGAAAPQAAGFSSDTADAVFAFLFHPNKLESAIIITSKSKFSWFLPSVPPLYHFIFFCQVRTFL
jgi:hypothetical protein